MSPVTVHGYARLARLGAALLLTVLTGLSLAAPPAPAAPMPKYTVDFCKDFNWMNLVTDVIYSPVWSPTGDCHNLKPPYDVAYAALGETDGTEEGAWEYPLDIGPHHDGLTLTKITTMMYGSDGSQNGAYQGLRVCGASCGQLITLSQPSLPTLDDWEQQTYAAGSPQVPADSYWVRFVGNCVTVPCGPTDPIHFLKIELEYSENTPPTAGVSKLDPPNYQPAIDFGWVNAPFQYRWRGADVGSGFTLVKWAAVGGGGGTLYDSCKASIFNAYLCPLSYGSLATIDPTSTVAWKEGSNIVNVETTDRVGLKSAPNSAQVRFKADRTDPTPASLSVVEKNASGWVADPTVTLAWTNAGESVENVHPSAPASGVVAARYDFDPADSGQPNPGPQQVDGANVQSADVTIPGPGLWSVSLRTIDAVGNESVPLTTVVGLDDALPGAPVVDPIGWIGSSYLIGGKQFNWSMPPGTKPRSGICGYGRSVDESPSAAAPATAGIDQDVTTGKLPDGMTEGSRFLHLRAISCSGVAGDTAHEAFDIDLTAPSASANLPDGAWTSGTTPLRLRAADAGSGVSEIHVSVDGSPPTGYPGDAAEPVLSEGMRSIEFFSRDAAGNESLHESLSFGVDRSAPNGWFEAVNPERPTLIAATVADGLSRLRSAAIEYRPAGSSGGWTPLHTRLDRSGDSTAAHLTARFPDASAPQGAYELRVNATDEVGNAGLIGSRFDGTVAGIVTPVRRAAAIGFAFELRGAARCAGKTTGACAPKLSMRRKIVRFGRGALVTGRLDDAAGRPLAGHEVKIFTSRGGPELRRESGTVVTGRDGRFRARVPAGVNRRVTARFTGSELIRPAEGTIELFTRSKISLNVGQRRVRGGRLLRVSGQLATGGERIGVLDLPMAVRVIGTRLSVETAVAQNGTYRAMLPLPKTTRPLRLRLQAALPQQAGWPFAAGESRVVSVTIVP